MDEEKLAYQKMQCLMLAADVGNKNGDVENIVSNAEKYWQWMRGSHDAKMTKTPVLDIS